MSDTSLKNLRSAIINAAPAAFALDAKFLKAGLNDPSVSVPPDYDSNIAAVFQVDSAADFKIEVSAANVGPVANGSFTVANATVPFLGGIIKSKATLIMALTSNNAQLVVQFQASFQKWSWSDAFPFMQGWPFDQL